MPLSAGQRPRFVVPEVQSGPCGCSVRKRVRPHPVASRRAYAWRLSGWNECMLSSETGVGRCRGTVGKLVIAASTTGTPAVMSWAA